MKRLLGIAALTLCGVVLIVLGMQASGAQPWEAIQGMIRGSLGTPNAISGTLKETTPLLLAGIAVFLALKAGLFNIGVEGQFTVGAAACAIVALKFPGIPGIVGGTLAAIIAGALWALPAGWIRAYRGGHEVITTIMLNNVAGLLTMALVAGPIKDPTQEGTTTASISEGTFLPHLVNQGPWVVSSALFVGVLGAFALAHWLRKFVSGYELRAVGANPIAAASAGIEAKALILKAMMGVGRNRRIRRSNAGPRL